MTTVYLLSCVVSLFCVAASSGPQDPARQGTPSFAGDIFPIITKHCLPCHAEDQFNPSELSLDSYELLMEGGKHGVPVVPGKPDESVLMEKLQEKPPFGDRMPLDPKKKKGQLSTKKLSDEEIQLLRRWIADGARDN